MALSRFRLNLFGPFESLFQGQVVSGFATDKIRVLLAYLAIESDKPHRRETLAALLWPDYTDQAALSNLRKSLYRLRKTLTAADHSLPDLLITQDRATITLHANAVDLDAARFSSLLKEVRSANDPIPLLTEIIDLYRGELLQGIALPDAYAFDEWLGIQREIFHQGAVDAFTRLLELQRARDDNEAILATAPRLLALDPWHENAYRQIMRAHLRQGNRAQAIAQYNELTAVLDRDLGVEPDSVTRALFEQIQSESVPNLAREERASPAPKNLLHHFPNPLSPLIGRERELENIAQMLQDSACRLLTITGPGGMGKTRLGIEAVRRLAGRPNRFTAGLFFVPLTQITHANLLITTVASSLGITLQPHMDPRQELHNFLKTGDFLLVLDNFEHLLVDSSNGGLPEAVAFLMEALNSVPGLSFLITSREPLSLRGEWVFALEGLHYLPTASDPKTERLTLPAQMLFIQNVRRYRPDFDADLQQDAIFEICRLTGGLPLALELAAAWIRALDCQAIAQQIAQSLDFLTSPYRDAPERQRSIRAVFASAWEQLSYDQQNALAAMSVFRGSFTAQAAVFVAEASLLDLAVLVGKSLLRRVQDRRYELHELVRQFAAEKLAGSGIQESVESRHTDFFFSLLEEQHPGFNGPTPEDSILLVRQDIDDLRAAWQWAVNAACADRLQRIIDGFAQYLVLIASSHEGERTFGEALAKFRAAPTEDLNSIAVQSRLAAHIAWFQHGLGKHQAALEHATQAVALAERCQDLPSRANGLSMLGWALQVQGSYAEAEEVLLEAVELFGRMSISAQASLTLIRLGSVYWRKRDFEKTLAYYRQSLEIEERLQSKRGITRAYGGIGLVYSYLERYDESLVWLAKTLALDRELGNIFGVARQLGNLGSVYYVLGEYEQALGHYQAAARIEQEAGLKSSLAIWLTSIADIHRQMKHDDLALQNYDLAITMFNEQGDRFTLCETKLGKAAILIKRAQYEEASILIAQGRQLAEDVQRKGVQLRARLLEVRLQAAMEDREMAHQLLMGIQNDLGEEADSAEKAHVDYLFWQIGDGSDYARKALINYERAFSQSRKGVYRERIEELTQFLAGHGET